MLNNKYHSKNIFGYKLSNSYEMIDKTFYEYSKPTPVKLPHFIKLNTKLIRELGLSKINIENDESLAILSGNKILDDIHPVSLAYSGHQFGHFSWQLGDGRAHLLGDFCLSNGQRYDIQLKGSGITPYSRGGDGRSPLGPVLREYLISEFMASVGIPTTRSLAIVSTGENIMRTNYQPSGILTRVADSHLRIGSFEYFAAREDLGSLKNIANYAIDRHFNEVKNSKNRYEKFFELVIDSQAKLLAKWMNIGFIHGVMNTDNVSISGQTIDYGPCAFMDYYSSNQVYSSIDTQGRYAYGNQVNICYWNLLKFGESLLPLFNKNISTATKIMNDKLEEFSSKFNSYWLSIFSKKFGFSIKINDKNDIDIIQKLFTLMEESKSDFTLTFRLLSDVLRGSEEVYGLFSNKDRIIKWVSCWKKRLLKEHKDIAKIAFEMNSINPLYIPRNHLVNNAIELAVNNNQFNEFNFLCKLFESPFSDMDYDIKYSSPPRSDQIIHQTFCGT